MINKPYNLRVEDGRIIASGSWEAIKAAARLYYGENVHLVLAVEQDIFAAKDEQIKNDLDREVLDELLKLK